MMTVCKPEGAPERSPKAGVGGLGVDGNGPKPTRSMKCGEQT